MKVTLERLPESRVQLDIEVDQDRVDKYYESAYRKLAGKARVPGFRPGKAPRAMVEKSLGRQRIMSEALDDLVPVVYNEAIEEQEVDAIDQPTLDDIVLDPVRFKFSVAVRPTVELGDYRAIRDEKPAVEVTDEDVAEQLMSLRRRHAMHVPVERPAAWGDFLTANVHGKVEDDALVDQDDAVFQLRDEGTLVLDGLREAIFGMAKGEEKEFDIPIPEDFRVEDFRGKAAHFSIKLSEIKEEQLPDEDDELAAQVSEEFESLDALKQRIRDDLLASRQKEVENTYGNALVEKLVAGATFDYPQVLVERETDVIIREMMGNDAKQYHGYLSRIGQTEAEYREGFKPAAAVRLRRGLAMGKLTEAEGIDVAPPEIDAEIERICEPMAEQRERFLEVFNSPDGRSTVRRDLLSQKTMARLAEIAAGQAPALPERAAAAETSSDAPAAPAAESEEAPE